MTTEWQDYVDIFSSNERNVNNTYYKYTFYGFGIQFYSFKKYENISFGQPNLDLIKSNSLLIMMLRKIIS